MYLSRVEIDINNRQKIRHLTHVGSYHNWVETSFPEEFESNVRSRKLWRIDNLYDKEFLLIVSKNRPDIGALEKYGVVGTGQSKQYDYFLNNITEGKQYSFRVTLNPVVSVITSMNESRGKVKPLPNYLQPKFLYDRSEKNGFKLEENEFYIVDRGQVVLKKSSMRDTLLSKATYEGRLTVTNKELFIHILTHGLGRKKAYGFGLMTVIPEE